MTVDWVFLSEDVEFGSDGRIVSMLRIVLPQPGFGVRPFPFEVHSSS